MPIRPVPRAKSPPKSSIPRRDGPIPGYAREDCDAFQGDAIRHAVTWKGTGDNVGRLAGKPVKLRFHLKQAKLFSFRFRNGR